MTQWINWGKGTAGSPNAISEVINTYATCTGTATQTSLTTALSASAGDQILIHQTKHASAYGVWEIAEVVSDDGATLTLKTALANSYSTGAQAVLIPQYTGGDISGAVTATAWDGSVGGIVALMSNGDLTISGSISANTSGFIGGTGTTGGDATGLQGKSPTSDGARNNAANRMSGGGGTNNGSTKSGGGGGSYATQGTQGQSLTGTTGGQPGATGGIADLTTLQFGGSGGQGGVYTTNSIGGTSGGIILIFAKNITITGSLTSNGGNGLPTTAGNNCGRGGGAAGGSILIKTQVATLGTNKLTVAGGIGGTGETNQGTGGNGGVGRIRCDYFTSVSGSTTPTLSSAQDLTLNIPSSGFFAFF